MNQVAPQTQSNASAAWGSTRYVEIMWVLLIVGLVAWRLACVPSLDDRTYQFIPESPLGFWTCQGPRIETLGDAFQAIANHHLYTPARLGNHLLTLSNLLPGWLTRTLLGLALACVFMLGACCAGGRAVWRAPGFVAVLWLTLWIVLPLNDSMAASAYGFNYFVPSALALTMVLLWQHEPLRGRWAWVPWVVALLAGCSHEGVALPLSAGLLLSRQFWGPRPWIYRGQWLLLTAMALAFLFSPGTMYRIDQSYEVEHGDVRYLIVHISLESYGLYLTLLAMLMVAWKRGWQHVWPWIRENMVCIVVMALSLALAYWIWGRGRVLWFSTLFGTMPFFRTLWCLFPWWRKRHLALAIVTFAALAVSVASVAMVQHRYSQETLIVRDLAMHSPNNIVYHDMIPLQEIPWWTLDIPMSSCSSFDLDFIGDEAHSGNVRALPTCMKKGGWEPLAGTADVMLVNRYCVSRKRLPYGHLILTYAADSWNTNPLYRVMNYFSGRAGITRSPHPVIEECLPNMGDTLWIYHFPLLRRLDHNRKIIAVDLP